MEFLKQNDFEASYKGLQEYSSILYPCVDFPIDAIIEDKYGNLYCIQGETTNYMPEYSGVVLKVWVYEIVNEQEYDGFWTTKVNVNDIVKLYA